MRNITNIVIVLFLFFSISSKAAVTFVPSTVTGTITTLAPTYCQGGTATAITYTYNTCNTGAGTGIATTVTWYSNTTNTTTVGGSVVSTAGGTSATTATGTTSYTPLTTAAGNLYYYCIITFTGTGTCNTTGTAVSPISGLVTVEPTLAAITGSPTVCRSSTTSLSHVTPGGTWASTATGTATVTSGGVVTGVSTGTFSISYTVSACKAIKAMTVLATSSTITLNPGSVCVGAISSLTSNASFGTWTSTTTAVATASTTGATTGTATGLTAGTTVISYSTGCGTPATKILTVLTTPAAIGGSSSVCVGTISTLTNSVGAGTWTSGTTAVATIGSGSGALSAVTAGTSLISYTIGTCAATTIVTVNANPAAITGTQTICNGAGTTFADGTAGGTWSTANSSVATIDASSPVNITGVSAGNTNISYTLGTGCFALRAITINTAPAAITGTTSLCVGNLTTLGNTVAGGTWTSGTTATATINSSTGALTAVAAGTTVITYAIGSCISTTTVTVNANPAAITGTQTVCEGAITTFTDGTAGGTWSSGNSGTATVNASSPVGITGVSAGTTNISYTITATGCFATRVVTVIDQPAAITGTASTCVGTTTTLANSVAGGTWTSVTTATATIGSGTGVVSAVAAGTSTISYTIGGTCAVTKIFTVNANPAAITGTQTVCEGAVTTFTDGTAGGTWSTANSGTATVNASSPVGITGVNAGTTNISYTITATGCFATRAVTVIDQPAAITGTASACVGTTTTLANSVAGGTWTSITTATATIGSGTGVVSAVAAGTSTISYTIGGTCAVTKIFTVNANPAAITGTQTVCEGAVTTFTDGTAGGTWSSANSAIASVNASNPVGVRGVLAGTTNISYTLTATGCFATRAVTVIAQPAAITGTAVACVGTTRTLSNSVAGGTWTSITTATATIGSGTGVVSAVAAGTSVISYTIGGTCAVTKIFTVNSNPAAITGTQTVCTGAVTTFTDGTAGGTWSSANSSIASVNASNPVGVRGVASGNTTISYTLTATSCFATRAVTVYAQPAAITGTAVACVGTLTTLANTVAGGTWTSVSTARATVVGGTGVVTAVSAGTSVISYTIGTCASTKTYTVNANPNAITGTQTVCTGAITTFTDGTAGGTWSSASSGIASVNASSPVGVRGVASGTTNISYTLTATGCFATRAVTVYAQPAAITGTAVACVGNLTTLSNTVAGGTWTSVTTTRATVVAGTGVVTAVSAGTSVISYTIGGTCFSTKTYTVNANPNAITGTQTVCTGSITTFTDATAGGTWSSASTGIATVNASSPVGVTGVAAGSTNISYTLSTGCFAIRAVTAITQPAAITGTASACVGVTRTLSNTVAGGTWTSITTATATIGSGTGVVSAVAAGTSVISYTIGGTCASTKTFTVNANPNAITGTQTVCSGSITTFTDGTAGGTWSSASTGTATVNASSPVGVTGVAAGSTNISYTLGTGCFAIRAVTVIAQPAAITGTASACVGTISTLSNSVAGGTWTSITTATATIGSGTGVVSAVAAGTSVISYTIGGTCASTKIFTVNSNPAAITGTQTVCVGAVTTFTDGTAGGTWTTANAGIATVNASSPVGITGIAAGNTNISYTLPTGCFAVRVVTTNITPTAITGTASGCIGTTTTLANTVGSGTWTSVTGSIATINSSTGQVFATTAGNTVISYTIGSCAATKTFTVVSSPSAITAASQSICEGGATTFSDATAGGTWTTANGSIATIDASSPVNITGVTAGNTTISYSLSPSCFAIKTITVNAQPGAITGNSSVCVAASTTLANGTVGGTWTTSNTGASTINAASGMVTGISVAALTITYTVNSCRTTKSFTVVNTVATPTGTQTMCVGGNVTLTSTTSYGTWTSSNAAIATVATAGINSGMVTGLSAGPATITYGTGCGANRTINVTVNSTPAAIGGTATVCVGGITTLTNSVGGGTWSSVTGAVATVVGGTGAVTGVTSGTSLISYTIGACAATITASVNPNPAAITGTQSICEGGVTTYSNATGGGTWNTANGSIATIDASSPVNITGIAAGNTNISYTLGTGCFATRPVTVNITPTAIGGIVSACAGTVTTLTNSIGGGSWSSVTGAVATIGSGTGAVSAVSAGTSLISYAIGSCVVTQVFTTHANPAVITGVQNVCEGSVTTFDNVTAGGTWSVAAPATATIDASTPVNINGVSAGTTTLSYTLGTGCFATRNVTVNTQPDDIGGTLSVCRGSSVTLSNTVGGGTWSRTNGTGSATINSGGVVTGITAGTVNITYTIGSCYSTAEFTVNIQPVAITGPTLVCDGSPITLSNSTSGGTWSSSVEDLAVVDSSTGVVTEVAPGSLNIIYSIGSCSSSYAITTNDASDMPDPITGDITFCIGTVSTLADATPGGVWSSVSTAVATVTAGGVVSGVTQGTSTISYTVTNACASTAVTALITIEGYPTASITSADDPCMGYATDIVFDGTTDADITYKVDGGSPIIENLTGGEFSLSSGALTGSHTYLLVSVSNSSCTSIINQTETVSPIPMTWVGGNFGHETEWNRAANWSCGFIPGETDDVIIPSGTTYAPVVETSGTGTTRNISIASGASVSLSSNAILNVKGNITNNGTVAGPGMLTMNDESAHTISGTGFVNNFDLNDSAGATINTGSRMTINSVLSITSGTLATSDSLVLNSTDTTTAARLEQLPFSGASITGKVKVNQFIPGGYRRYRFWSHPFNTAISLGQVENYIDITGTGGSANGFTTTASNAASAFRYNPMVANSSLTGDPGWKEFTNISASAADTNKLNRYQSIRLFMRGEKGQGLGYITETPLPVVISQRGVLNQGDQTITLAKGSSANQDYNMVGNPYASPVDIGTVAANAKTAGQVVGTAFYVWNTFLGASGLFQAIPINTVTPTPYYIQANEGFQIRADHNGATLAFSESNKGSSRTLNLMKAQPECVSLYIYDANYHPWDMLHIRFNDGASNEEDNDHDARKLMGPDFGFYSLSAGDQKLCIDTRPYETEQVIPLGISSAYAQEYIIKAEGLVVPKDGAIYLHDKLLKQYVLLSPGTEYRFNITKNEQTQGDNRFELSMKPSESAAAAKGLQVSMTPNPATDDVKINFTAGKKDKVSVRVLDMSGVSVYNEELGVQQMGTINVSLGSFASGIYMVEITSGKDKVVKRLVKE